MDYRMFDASRTCETSIHVMVMLLQVAQEVCVKWGVPIVGALHRDQCRKRRGKYIKVNFG